MTKAIKFSLIAMAVFWGSYTLYTTFKDIWLLSIITQFIAIVGYLGFFYCIYLGGFSTVARGAATIAKWGWYLVPTFPIDIFVSIFVFFFIILLFFTVPALFYLGIRHSLKKENVILKTYIEASKNQPQIL